VDVVQGTLPVDYLDDSGEFSSHGIFANARQILEQFNVSISLLRVVIIIY